jgi:small subunit ribosomal protein S29e/phospholipase B1
MTAQQFQAELTDVMVQLHQTFPKTFVATMTIFNISQVWDVHSDRAYCDAAVPILHECSCLTDDQSLRTKMDILGKQINDVRNEREGWAGAGGVGGSDGKEAG